MKLFLQLTLLCCLATFCLAFRRHGSTSNSNRQQGEPCTPRYRYTCGNRTMIGDVDTKELTEDDGFMGPNVCSTTKMYRVQAYSYSYQRACRFCGLYCYSTGVCNGTFHNITRETIACCDGFTTGDEPTAMQSDRSRGRRYAGYNRNRRLNELRSDGCPIMLRDNVVQCLEDLGLSRFIDEASKLQELFNNELQSTNEDSQFTIFAPSNDAFTDAGEIASSTIEGHITESNIPSKSLFSGKLISTRVQNATLHAGIVRQRGESEKQYFLNGALIADPDACKARNGIVHVMDSFIPFSANTIARVLESQPDRFSTFNRLLEGADIMRYLRDPVKSRTVFAPTNEAFNKLPRGAVECLLREENNRYLQFLVLIHIVAPAEYSSTLAERSHVPTFAWYYIAIDSANDTILVTRDRFPIQEEDIPANNGVIHVLRDVIVPNEINFERLCPVVPTTSPPVVTGVPSTSAPIVPSGPLPTAPVVENSGDGPPLFPIDEIDTPSFPVGEQDI